MATVATRSQKAAERRAGGRGPSTIAVFVFLVLAVLSVIIAVNLDARGGQW